jgi:hypothetical protein
MILFYKDFMKESRDASVNTPNHVDNLSDMPDLDPEFKKANKIDPPEINTDFDPVDVMDYETFSSLFHRNSTDNTNYNLVKYLDRNTNY